MFFKPFLYFLTQFRECGQAGQLGPNVPRPVATVSSLENVNVMILRQRTMASLVLVPPSSFKIASRKNALVGKPLLISFAIFC